ncbi:heterokaryon incompatibility protein-domain-containing protein, partial [Lasiosphaeria hispida]
MSGRYRNTRYWNLYVLDGQLPWPDFPTTDVVPDFDPASDMSMSFLQRHISDCDANHPGCRVAASSVPTRLIQLVGGNTFRIVESANHLVDPVPYVALSYCWGADQALKLKEDNKTQLQQGLPITTLPIVFHDTITVAKKLGIQYLWIDSLCILQDSDSDWRKESKRMAQVYSGAYITIAAASSATTTESFLNPGPRDYGVYTDAKPKRIPIKDSSGNLVTELLALPENVTSRHYKNPNIRHADPLTKRGWTLQEKLLSTRMISFGLAELEWVCASESACECRTDEENESVHSPRSKQELLGYWYDRLAEYCGRNLTFPKDKLPALAGLARVVGDKLGSKYLAGIWEDDLLGGLTWYVNLDDDPSFSWKFGPLPGFPRDYRAPSWSWASINGRVEITDTE